MSQRLLHLDKAAETILSPSLTYGLLARISLIPDQLLVCHRAWQDSFLLIVLIWADGFCSLSCNFSIPKFISLESSLSLLKI